MFKLKHVSSLVLVAVAAMALAQNKRTAVVGPWIFDQGTETSRQTAIDTVISIADKRGYAEVSKDQALKLYNQMQPPMAFSRGLPKHDDLRRYARAAGADVVLYGIVRWHTRSLWVGTGPKTVSTATADVYAYDARSNRVVYSRRGAKGRSDEKENGLKDIADLVLTPLVTVVSGGPATPREQRAVQIALGRAYRGWPNS